jgi:EAL domain-containing protein (putative c-di-GMP-specific phosphodiesterase class I)
LKTSRHPDENPARVCDERQRRSIERHSQIEVIATGLVATSHEGVETESQLSFLTQEGCDEVQGYLTGKPFPIEVYAELVGRDANKTRHTAVAV